MRPPSCRSCCATSADAGDSRLSGQGVARRSYPAGIKSYLIN